MSTDILDGFLAQMFRPVNANLSLGHTMNYWTVFAAFILQLACRLHSQANCPVGTTVGLASDRCYLFGFSKAAWVAAEAHCVAHGGHLVSIHDAFTNSLLVSMAVSSMAYGVDGFWTGLITAHRKWTWVDETSLNYANWAAGW